MINWDDPRATFSDRYKGYCEALRKADIKVARYLYNEIAPFESPKKVIEQLFGLENKKRPDAIFCAVDVIALQVMDLLAQKGIKIPDDVALIGMGEGPLSSHPLIGLTTVGGGNIREKFGVEAAKIALKMIDNPTRPPIHKVITQNELNIRKTA